MRKPKPTKLIAPARPVFRAERRRPAPAPRETTGRDTLTAAVLLQRFRLHRHLEETGIPR